MSMKSEEEWRCCFVPEWICRIHVKEIPLEVCKLCIKAKRLRTRYVVRSVSRKGLPP